MSWTGRRLRRFEDPALLQGLSHFVADVADRDPRALHGAFVRSTAPAGKIRSIESPAGATVLTAESLGPMREICARLDRPDFIALETPVLSSEVVRHPGEPIALVVAGSRAEAEDIAEEVIVDIEPSDPVLDVHQAMQATSPTVHAGLSMPLGNNVVLDARLETSDFDAAVARANEVVALDIRSHRQNALPLEARGAVASHDLASGRTTLTASNQMPHMLRTALADILDVPESQLRVVTPEVGGAFGQKMCVPREYVALVAAARLLGTTIAWIEDRLENLLASWHSRDHRYRIRGAFSADGKLLALDGDLLCNIGAYSNYPVTFGVEPLMALAELPGPYMLTNYRVRARAITTNMCPIAPYRGVSRPVLTLAMERLMDSAARKLGIDPVAIRNINLVHEFPYSMPTGLRIDEGSYTETLKAAVQAISLEDFRERKEHAARQGRYLGVGFSVFGERTGYGTPAFAARSMEITPGYETVRLEMDPSGGVIARIGASPHGQGLATALAQLLADELGIKADQVSISHGDTDTTPYGWGTFASRSMVIAGGAATLAARELADQLRQIAAHELEADPADIKLEEGAAAVAGTRIGVPISDIARTAHHSSHRLPDGVGPGLAVSATYDPAGTFSNACHAAVVEVDIETGHVRLERFVVVADAGLEVNPMLVEGQIHGGVTQGIANALYEELVTDEHGNLMTASLMDFAVPTACEIPDLEVTHLQTITDASISGAKGVGEGGAIGAPAAVLNAISDALSPLGIEVNEMPATPSRIRKLIRDRESQVGGGVTTRARAGAVT